jgi:oxygen-independent coproporphyrinogen-3 oxidase
MMKNNKTTQMIYVHIPFCNTKCHYCNFVSFCTAQNQLKQDYFEKLNQEIAQNKNKTPVSSVFFGGGTPSSVDSAFIVRTLKTIKKNFTLTKNCEITIECNPQSTTAQKLADYRKAGFNRLSFGVQSLDEQKLERIGRFQTKQQVFEAIENAKNVGFSNISADLLLGLENQTPEEVVEHAKTLINMGICHISAYMLILEEDTPLFAKVQKGEMVLPTDDQTVDIYNALFEFLLQQAFERYEVSNFAKKGFQSRHNLGYWQDKEYLGFGVAAHSYKGRKRFANSSNIIDYLQNSNKTTEKINKARHREEAIMLGLRTKYGVSADIVGKKRIVKQLINQGFLRRYKGNLVICNQHFGVSNQIILKLI